MSSVAYCSVLSGLLLISGAVHILAPGLAEKRLNRARNVRVIGAILVVLALPCFVWRGWYFLTVAVLLTASGLWRLLFPHHSIRAQQRTYPRWVHGCLLIAGAALVWAFAPARVRG